MVLRKNIRNCQITRDLQEKTSEGCWEETRISIEGFQRKYTRSYESQIFAVRQAIFGVQSYVRTPIF